MLRKLAAGTLAVAAASTLMMTAGPSTAMAADTYILLKQASKGGVTAKLWLNKRTRAIHGQALNLRKGEVAQMARNNTIVETKVAQRDTASLNTKTYVTYPDRYAACAGSQSAGSRFVCTQYHLHQG